MISETSRTPLYFLGIVVILQAIAIFFDTQKALLSLTFFVDIVFKIIPVFVLIFIIMTLMNYFIKPKRLVKYLGKESGIKGWIIAIGTGILSSGPIYMWYPLLNELQKHGIRDSLIATFLYNRAIKIPLLPMLIYYFGIAYSLILLVVMIILSIGQGWLTEKLMEVEQ
jgi:uncharacterized membrane protein YraQ (UPF0718 family)